jgi:hypothetical protein
MNNAIISLATGLSADRPPLLNEAENPNSVGLLSVGNIEDGSGLRGRVVSRVEAVRIVDEIRRRAEEGRLAAAEDEARRQFDLETHASVSVRPQGNRNGSSFGS